jgi:hypothetical protein
MVDMVDRDHTPRETVISLEPGEYTITVRLPDGSSQMREFTLKANERLPLAFSAARSPREWVASAAIAGAIKEALPVALREDADAGLGLPKRIEVLSRLSVINVSTEVVGGPSWLLEPRPMAETAITLAMRESDQRFERYEVMDARPPRYESQPAWVQFFVQIAASDGREEVAVLPSVGREGPASMSSWRPSIVIDRQAPASEPMTTVIVQDRRWASLLAFVGSRDFAAGETLLSSNMYRTAIDALKDKMSNPLAAVAGALIAVANSSSDIDNFWDPWLVNLTNWFPDIPDGPIILGRRRLMRARIAEEIKEARDYFMKGFDRGVPVYSLSMDWLARGLENLPGDDAELDKRRRAVRAFANRADSGRAFTVIRTKG